MHGTCFGRKQMKFRSTKSAIKKIIYACTVCNATLMSKDSLKKHMYVQHEGGRETWACNLCSNKLGSKDSLKRHYKSIHGIDRSELTVEDGHRCNVCKLCFGTKYSLAEHKCSGKDET